MFGILGSISRRVLESTKATMLIRVSTPISEETITFGPFNFNIQKRWKKPVVTAQTRLEDRTRDLKLDKLMGHFKRMKIILKLVELLLNRRGSHASVHLLSKCRNVVGLSTGMGIFLRKYPHIFDIYTHPVTRNPCCRLTQKMLDLIKEEAIVIKECEAMAVKRLKKLLMISPSGKLHIHSLWLIRREIGLREDFRCSILLKYTDVFTLESPDIVALVSRDDTLAIAEVEIWREREYREKWLSEFETKYAFPIHLPTGFKIEKGFREKLKNWQRLPYLKPYEKKEVVRARSYGGKERFEKRAVGILHELLSLTVEKMIDVERLSHFRRDFNMEVNIRELLLKHPGIFYVSTKGNSQTVFLREAYSKSCLIEPNPLYEVRRKVLDLVLLGCRNTRELKPQEDPQEQGKKLGIEKFNSGPCDGRWVIPILGDFNVLSDESHSDAHETFDEEKDPKFAGGEIHKDFING